MPRGGRSGRPRILVTCADELAVLACVRALASAGYEPWTAGSTRFAYAALSRAGVGFVKVPDPAEEPADFADAVVGAATRIRARAVLPGTERALAALVFHGHAAADGTTVAVPGLTTLELLTSKARLADLAVRSGLSAPRTQVLTVDHAGSWDGEYPAVVKPLRSESWYRTRFVHASAQVVGSPAELAAAAAALPGDELLVQERVGGVLEAVAGVAWHGELVAPVQFRAFRTWPLDAGMVAAGETVPLDEGLVEGVRRLAEIARFDGILQVQFVRSEDDALLIDVNARLYASLALATAAGRNLPAAWATLLLGGRPAVGEYRPGRRFRSELLDARVAVAAAAQRDWRLLGQVVRPRRRTTHAVLGGADPLPAARAIAAVVARRRR